MFLVGLTGGIASGKSTASSLFKKFHTPIIDADLIARKVVEPGQPAYSKIRKEFGDEVFKSSGLLDRDKLGQLIFKDPVKRKLLNSIVHPAIKKQMMWEVFTCLLKGHKFAILDIPLLFETKQMLPFLSYTIAVHCTEAQQLKRLTERNNLSEEDAISRINSQMPMCEKIKLASFVVDNSKSIEFMEQQVIEINTRLQASNKHLVWRLAILAVLLGVTSSLVLLFDKVIL